jgi:molecular chaperone DnaK
MAVFSAERMLKESADGVEPADRTKIEEGIAAVKSGLENDKPDDIKKAMDALTEAVYTVTAGLYQKAQAEQAAQRQAAGTSQDPGSDNKKQDDSVVNADYKVKEE